MELARVDEAPRLAVAEQVVGVITQSFRRSEGQQASIKESAVVGLLIGFDCGSWWMLTVCYHGYSVWLSMCWKVCFLTLCLGILSGSGLLVGLRREDWVSRVGMGGCILVGYVVWRVLVD